jgi:HSP20 family protein
MANVLVRRRNSPFAPLFDDLLNDFWTRSTVPARAAAFPAVGRALMDVIDKGEAFEIKVDMPGVRKEDINVAVEGSRVSISAEAKTENEVKDGDKVLHTERYEASYSRAFELPAEVTESGADARFENGVLTLTLPKRAPVASRRVTVS